MLDKKTFEICPGEIKQAIKNIGILRRHSKFPIAKVAEFLKMTPEEYDLIELGRSSISFEALERLSDLYCVEMYDLIESKNILKDCHITNAYATCEELGLLDMRTLYSMVNFNKIIREAQKMDSLCIKAGLDRTLNELRNQDRSGSVERDR